MTEPTTDKAARLLLLEREVKRLRLVFPDVLALKTDLALMLATNRRLIGEAETYQRNEVAMRKRIADQGAELFVLRQARQV